MPLKKKKKSIGLSSGDVVVIFSCIVCFPVKTVRETTCIHDIYSEFYLFVFIPLNNFRQCLDVVEELSQIKNPDVSGANRSWDRTSAISKVFVLGSVSLYKTNIACTNKVGMWSDLKVSDPATTLWGRIGPILLTWPVITIRPDSSGGPDLTISLVTLRSGQTNRSRW